jgi:hypothetical protein
LIQTPEIEYKIHGKIFAYMLNKERIINELILTLTEVFMKRTIFAAIIMCFGFQLAHADDFAPSHKQFSSCEIVLNLGDKAPDGTVLDKATTFPLPITSVRISKKTLNSCPDTIETKSKLSEETTGAYITALNDVLTVTKDGTHKKSCGYMRTYAQNSYGMQFANKISCKLK